ncbi:MAG: copper chaperone [Ignavibacteriae bacterium]|nr:MAG: copper chaperone [Ignavibacteriota bacterium]
MKKETIKVTGMSCGHCVKSVEKVLAELPLESSKVEINSIDVEFDEQKVSREKIVEAIEEAGYELVK